MKKATRYYLYLHATKHVSNNEKVHHWQQRRDTGITPSVTLHQLIYCLELLHLFVVAFLYIYQVFIWHVHHTSMDWKDRRSKYNCSTQLIQYTAHRPQHKSWLTSRPRQHNLSSPLFPLDPTPSRLPRRYRRSCFVILINLLPILLSRHDNAF